MLHDPLPWITEHRLAISIVAVASVLVILILWFFRRRFTIAATVLGLASAVGLACLAYYLESHAVLTPQARLEAQLQAVLTEAKKKEEALQRQRTEALTGLTDLTREIHTATGIPMLPGDSIDSAMDLMRGLHRELIEAKRRPIVLEHPPQPPLQPKSRARELLLELLDNSLTTEHFRVERITNGELITGKRGKYYLVRMVARAGPKLTFKDREYQLLDAEAGFRSSCAQFAMLILRNIDGAELFVRGSADSRKYTGALKSGVPQVVEMLPSDGKGRYKDELTRRQIGPMISNTDLPQLRAAYARALISDSLPNIRILEGEIRSDETARSVEFIMFVA